MTYFQFLLIFLVPALVLLLYVARRSLSATFAVLCGVLAVVAIIYTGPWDSAIIANGVWSYGHGRVLGVVIARVPLEEYCFYVLQVVLTATVTLYFLRARQ